MKWRGTGIVLSESRAPQNTRTLSSQQATQRSGWVASKVGLPAIGSKLLNENGIEWVVRGHAPAPTYETLHRWRSGRVELQMDMYPLIEPQNLSPRLSEFMHAINRCTTKRFGIFDTMPGRRKDGHVPGANSIDTLCNPEANLLFLDAARIHETIIAHEFGHAWVQYVDDCEDFRVLEDTSNPQRMRQVSLVQSFVLDLKVNGLLRQKGFDMSPIEEDQAHTLANLGQMLAHGRRFEMAREEAFYAMQVADAMVRRELAHATSDLVRLDSSLEFIRHSGSPLAALAESFAASVTKHGYDSRDGVLSAIDECLLASFDFCGDSIDLYSELIAVNPPEPDTDKFPDWIPALPPKVKCQVGRHMARNDISSEWGLAVNPTITGKARVTFHSPEGDTWSELRLFHPLGPPTRYSHLPDCVAEALAMKMRNQTGSYQLHSGPPHRNPLNPPDPPIYPTHLQTGLFPRDTLGHPPARHETSTQHSHGGTPHSGPPSPPRPATSADSGQLGWSSNHNFGGIDVLAAFVPAIGRPYMAGLGRWTTQARLQEQLAGEHPYAYANCNPTTFRDPSGLSPGSCTEPPQSNWHPEHPCDVRTKVYCDQAELYNRQNRALNCICIVSDMVCQGVIKDPAGGFNHQQRAWFDCMNRCIFNHFVNNDTPKFRIARRICDQDGWTSNECEYALIRAEQDAYTWCLPTCKSLTGVSPGDLPYGLPGFPFPLGGSYGDRVGAAWRLCVQLGWGAGDSDQFPPYPGGFVR